MTDILHLPAQEPRVETGPMQFGDDWPGVFFRGDNALFFAIAVDHAAEVLHTLAVANGSDANLLTIAQLRGLASDLRSCSVGDTGWPPTTGTVPVEGQTITSGEISDEWEKRFTLVKARLLAEGKTAEEAERVAAIIATTLAN